MESLVIEAGKHQADSGHGCLLEWVSCYANEPWSDHPKCVSPVLATFGRQWTDMSSNEVRATLKQYIPLLIGTAGDAEADERRCWMAADWIVRIYLPAWFALSPNLRTIGAELAASPEIVSASTVPKDILSAACYAAMDANLSDAKIARSQFSWDCWAPGVAAETAARSGYPTRESAKIALTSIARKAVIDASWAENDNTCNAGILELKNLAHALFRKMITGAPTIEGNHYEQ